MTDAEQASTYKVGVIGVGSPQSWAREAHVTAVNVVPGLELVAVATRDQDTAQSTADELGALRGYGDALELIGDDDVEIVTVGSPVPAHRELILAALDAGNHVVTEWPVGTSTAQTEEIAAAAASSGRHTAVDLQSRMNPAAVRARELVTSGAIGRVLTVTVYSSTAGFGQVVTSQSLSLEDPATGMNLTTIQAAHTLDLTAHIAGPLASLACLRTVRFPELQISDAHDGDAATFRRTVPDHALVQARFVDGGALSVQVVGGRTSDDTPFRMEIVGETGTLTLKGGAPRGFQAGTLQLLRDERPVEITDPLGVDLPDSVVNVAHVYAALRDDISSNSATAPSFADAVALSHLIDDLVKSADQQVTVTPSAQWP